MVIGGRPLILSGLLHWGCCETPVRHVNLRTPGEPMIRVFTLWAILCVAAVASAADADWPRYGGDDAKTRHSTAHADQSRQRRASSRSPGSTTPPRKATRRPSPSSSGARCSATRPRTRPSRSTPRPANYSGCSIPASPAPAPIAVSCTGRTARTRACSPPSTISSTRWMPPPASPSRAFGKSGRIDLRENLGRDPATQSVRLTTPGVIYRDLMIVGGRVGETLPASPGHVRAYDVRTGALRWTFRTIPQPGEPGYDTWPKDAWQYIGGANSWPGMTLDEKRGLVFVPTGSAAADFYGGESPRRQSVRQLPAGARCRHRQTALAFPVRETRRARSRPAHRADAGHAARQGQDRRRAGADHQAGLRVRAGSRHRQAGVSHRGSARAAIGRAGRSRQPHLPAAHAARALRAPAADRR